MGGARRVTVRHSAYWGTTGERAPGKFIPVVVYVSVLLLFMSLCFAFKLNMCDEERINLPGSPLPVERPWGTR